MSYIKIHRLYEQKFGELPFSIRDINHTSLEDEITELLEDALLNNEKVTENQFNQIIEITDLPDDVKT
tara:strand:+ start:957 stop:1160 length:204 start_codon:yes stop_codon:yes gene_type:complete